MKNLAKILRDHLNIAEHEQVPENPPIRVLQKCVIRRPLGQWEQGVVAGYLEIRKEPYALVACTERPDENGIPAYDFVQVSKLAKFRPIPQKGLS
jgi:hypothetical protein